MSHASVIASVIMYFAVIVSICLYVYRRNRSRAGAHAGEDAMSAHYLGDRSFGPLVSTMTIFASLFSGYTVVGIPDEGYATGFLAWRWVFVSQTAIFSQVLLGPRLRKLSVERRYQGPADFIVDRYRSQLLRYVIVPCLLVPSWLYLTAQISALTRAFNKMLFDLPDRSPWGTIIVALIILGYEWLGGLSSVAYADTLAGTILFFGSVRRESAPL